MNNFSNSRKTKIVSTSAVRKMTMYLNMRVLPLPPRRRRQKNMMVTCTKHSFVTFISTSSMVVRRRWMTVPMAKCAMTNDTLEMMKVMRGSRLK